jgi:hypothetical protein
LVEFHTAALGGLDQIGETGLALQKLGPAELLFHPVGIGCRELPSIEEALNQRLERVGAGLE